MVQIGGAFAGAIKVSELYFCVLLSPQLPAGVHNAQIQPVEWERNIRRCMKNVSATPRLN